MAHWSIKVMNSVQELQSHEAIYQDDIVAVRMDDPSLSPIQYVTILSHSPPVPPTHLSIITGQDLTPLSSHLCDLEPLVLVQVMKELKKSVRSKPKEPHIADQTKTFHQQTQPVRLFAIAGE